MMTGVTGCKRKRQLQGDEDLKAVVAEDRRMAQEEDAIVDAAGRVRWALRRQDALFLVE